MMNRVLNYLLVCCLGTMAVAIFGMNPNEFVRTYSGKRLMVIRHGDITQQPVDAIVNAAQPALLGGGGIDGVIHQAAGRDLYNYCARLSVVNDIRCATGQARITPSFQLNRQGIKYIIHAVGPTVQNTEWQARLGQAYQNILDWTLNQQNVITEISHYQRDLSSDGVIRTIAIPSISIGIYGCPVVESTQIAIRAIKGWIDQHQDANLQEIRLLVYDNQSAIEEQNFNIYVRELAAAFSNEQTPGVGQQSQATSQAPTVVVPQTFFGALFHTCKQFVCRYKLPIMVVSGCLMASALVLWRLCR